MSHDAERKAIQREGPAGTPASGRTGITETPPTPLQPKVVSDGVRRSRVTLFDRVRVLTVGLGLGAAFALFVAGPMMPSSMGLAVRAQIWVLVMCGPIGGTTSGMAAFCPCIGLGWLGLLLIPRHPIRPSVETGCLTVVGLVLWFFSGFLTVIAVVWGA